MENLLKNGLYIVIIIIVLGYFAYMKGWIFANFKTISAVESYDMIKKGDVVLLDVRTQAEHKVEHIRDSLLIPVHELELKLPTLSSYKNKEIIVYCRSGNRSVTASRILDAHGFKVYNMRGGMIEWNSMGYEVKR